MNNYRKTSHAVYDLKYHIVWITKYRKAIISGKIAERTRELIRMVCKNNDTEILAGRVSRDHIQLLVSSPHISVSKLVQYVKGYTSRKLLMEYKELNKQFWGQHLWARGYFAASSGNVTDEVIVEYIKIKTLKKIKEMIILDWSHNFRRLSVANPTHRLQVVVVELITIVFV